ncbi:hypothetical protein [Elizabethkingia meningoseptica]
MKTLLYNLIFKILENIIQDLADDWKLNGSNRKKKETDEHI